ncbi:MAG: peptidylprolyl isomerase [Aestuariivita sp.]|nr:peptidylprolyl isomerase [Aestuariivita sp.]
MKKLTALLFTFVTLFCLVTTTQAEDDPSAQTVMATINGKNITLGNMIVTYLSLPEQYINLSPALLFESILMELIQQEVLAQSYVGDPSTAIELTLQNNRRALLAAEAIEGKVNVAIPDAEIETKYAQEYSNIPNENEYNAAHILLTSKSDALQVISDLNAGITFETLAKERSTGPSGPNGGSLGWFGRGQMVPEFETAVMALEKSEVSEPVQTQFGWHVIRLNETRIKPTPSLDDVRETIVRELQRAEIEKHIQNLMSSAEILRPDMNSIDPSVLSKVELLSK